MTIEELKKLKEVALKSYKYEEDSCKRLLGEDYSSLETSGVWENHKDKLIEDSLMGNNILVIGSEAILDKQKYPNTNGDSELLLLECMKEKNKKRYGFADAFSDIIEFPNLISDISKVLEDKKDQWKKQAIDMLDPCLRLLLESKCFRLIITTAYDPILEYALQSVWGNNLVVKNILDERLSERDIRREDNRKSEFYDITPTLFYAFGKAKNGAKSEYAIDDDLKVVTISSWLGLNRPKQLLEYIERKDILAIGCNFENWVFRFLWYILAQKPDMSYNDKKKGSVAIMLSTNTSDVEKTKEFFDKKDIAYYHNSRLFMGLLAPELVSESVPQDGDIFISYASEDFPTARKIYDYLKSQRQSVWFDIRLKAGDRYGDYIRKGINQCNVFMPILSNQTIKDIDDIKANRRKEPRYYMREWAIAQEHLSEIQDNSSMFIVIPVVIEDYSPTDDTYHNMTFIPDCIHGSSVYYSSRAHVSLDDLMKVINQHITEWKETHPNNKF